jgi:hypothetical protein
VFEHTPGSVVETPGAVELGLVMRQLVPQNLRDFRVAAGVVLYLVKLGRKAVEIVNYGLLGSVGNTSTVRLPVSADDHEGLSRRQLATNLAPHLSNVIVHQRIHRVAVPHEEHWHARAGFEHRFELA